MFFCKWFYVVSNDSESEKHGVFRELKRLQLLENGIKYYSGGIFELHERTNYALTNKGTKPVDILSLLNDLSAYFRDLKIAGQLKEERHF